VPINTTTKPNKDLQAKLREMIAEVGLEQTSQSMQIGREQLARYLAGIPLTTAAFRGIEVTLAGAHLPEAQTANVSRR
jgi:hypothetical protein